LRWEPPPEITVVGRVSSKDILKGYDSEGGRVIDCTARDADEFEEDVDWESDNDSNADTGEDNLTRGNEEETDEKEDEADPER
jgi:hypothetical protein